MTSSKQTIYVETTIISAVVGRLSPVPENTRKQKLTRHWWRSVLPHFAPVISTYVFEEISDGDDSLAIKRRTETLRFRLIVGNTDIEKLAGQYLRAARLPEKAWFDACHVACATIYKIDYLVTWNCNHINNGVIRKVIDRINRAQGIDSPTICTPEELMGVL
ncbi:MAG: type II toxin-antitoxin system VapC family toxin [Deltaproteobacteria bacterium]|nr:type II toxin-antitoxin system VapC family toxin [Deltaproteobacteria bacterium]